MLRLTRDQIVYAFDPHQPPAVTVDPGSELLLETWDARTGSITRDDQTFEHPYPKGPNPATGPIFVRGAEAGDALVVEILAIRLSGQGFTGVRAGLGVLGQQSDRYQTRILEVADGQVVFSDRIRFPVRPMIGVIGTAPAGAAVGNLHPGAHGGNMDHNDVRVGARVHLPVFVPGALLALGDLHASMGDGEVSITALEICGEAHVRVGLAKGAGISRPRIEFPDAWITTGDGPGVADAIRVACQEMAALLQGQYGLSFPEAYMLLGIRGDVRVGQCAEPRMVGATARVLMPKF